MKQNNLFPYRYKRIGWYIFVLFAVSGILLMAGIIPDNMLTTKMPKIYSQIGFFGSNYNDWMDEIIIIGLALSMLLIGFSKEKDEDELISEIRMQSVAFAAKVQTGILIVGTLLFYGLTYFYFMVFNLFIMMFIFILKFKYELHKFRQENKEEQP